MKCLNCQRKWASYSGDIEVPECEYCRKTKRADYIRCPRCGWDCKPNETDRPGLFIGGEISVLCQCGHEYTVTSNVTVTWDSPQLEACEAEVKE